MHPGSPEWMREGVIASLLLVLLLPHTTQGARVISQVLQDPDSRQVDSVESFKAALLDNVQHIIFTGNVTLNSDVFPEVPATCFSKAPLKVCEPNVVIYGNNTDSWPVDTSALWEADASVEAWIDFRWLRANLILTRKVTIQNINLVQMFDDNIPYAFSFATVDDGAILIKDSAIWSPCGDRTPRYILDTLLTVLDINAQYVVLDDKNSFQFFDSKVFHLYDSINAGNIQIVDTLVQCYNDTVYQFAPKEVPKIWLPGSDTVTVRQPPDNCQRRYTAGADYRGNFTGTRDGQKCQFWNTTVPWDHTRTVENYPYSGLGDHNFCRNPDNTPDGVWCYVDSPDRLGPRWSYCAVPYCDEKLPWDVAPASASGDKSTLLIAIVVPVACVAVCALAFLCWQRRRHTRRAPRLGDLPREKNKGSSVADSARDSGVLSKERFSRGRSAQPTGNAPQDELNDALIAIGITEQQLVLESVIGRGSYGVVYLGTWKGMKVAVKTILFQDAMHRTKLGPAGLHRAYAEAAIAFALVHPNVVSTYHHEVKQMALEDEAWEVNANGEDDNPTRNWKLFLVQEYCNGGNIATAIRNKFFVNDDGVTPHLPHIFQAAWEMACALQYIHSKDIIHGDLNPNNVLLKTALAPNSNVSRKSSAEINSSEVYSQLGKGFTTKLADFGLSMKMDAMQTHFSNMRQGTPFYVAPEVQSEGHLTKASDVFPFGVLLWELYNSQPCFQKTKNDFFMRSAQFPRFPPSCPLPYAVLTVACLHPHPASRPSLDTIISMLQDMLTSEPTGFQPSNTRAGQASTVPSSQETHEHLSMASEPYAGTGNAGGAEVASGKGGSVVESAVFVSDQSTVFHTAEQPGEVLLSEDAWRSVLLELERMQGGPTPETMADEAMALIAEAGNGEDGGILLTLNRTLDTATELGHEINNGPDTSDDESDDFHDALDELASDGSFISARSPQNSVGSKGKVAPRMFSKGASPRVSRAGNPSINDDMMATNLSPYHLLMMKHTSSGPDGQPRGPKAASPRGGRSANNSSTLPANVSNVSSRSYTRSHAQTSIPNSNRSGISDWDAMSAQNDLVDDPDTGRTHFRHVRRQPNAMNDPQLNDPEQLNAVSGTLSTTVSKSNGSLLRSGGPTLDQMMSGEQADSGQAPIDPAMMDKVVKSLGTMYARGTADQARGRGGKKDAAQAAGQQTSPSALKQLESVVGTVGSGHHRQDRRSLNSGSGCSSIGDFLVMPDVPQLSRDCDSSAVNTGEVFKNETPDLLSNDYGSNSESDSTEGILLKRPVIKKTGRFVALTEDSARKSPNSSFQASPDAGLSYIGSRPGNVTGSVCADPKTVRSGDFRVSSGDVVAGGGRSGALSRGNSRPSSMSMINPDEGAGSALNSHGSALNSHVNSMSSMSTMQHLDSRDSGGAYFGNGGAAAPRGTSDALNSHESGDGRFGSGSRSESTMHMSAGGGGMRLANGSFVSMTSTGDGYVANKVNLEYSGNSEATKATDRRRWTDAVDDRKTSEGSEKASLKSGASVRRGEFQPMRVLAPNVRAPAYERGNGSYMDPAERGSGAAQNGQANGAPPRSLLFDTLDDDDESATDYSADANQRKISVTDVVTHGWATVETDVDESEGTDALEGRSAALAKGAKSSSGRLPNKLEADMASYGFGSLAGRPRGLDDTASNGQHGKSAADDTTWTSEEDSPLSMRGLHSLAPHSAPTGGDHEAANGEIEIDLNPAKVIKHMSEGVRHDIRKLEGGNRHMVRERVSTHSDPAATNGASAQGQAGRGRSARKKTSPLPPPPELHKFVHPVLRSNKAAMAHVRHVSRPVQEDGVYRHHLNDFQPFAGND